jgi:hypothetical protein
LWILAAIIAGLEGNGPAIRLWHPTSPFVTLPIMLGLGATFKSLRHAWPKKAVSGPRSARALRAGTVPHREHFCYTNPKRQRGEAVSLAGASGWYAETGGLIVGEDYGKPVLVAAS